MQKKLIFALVLLSAVIFFGCQKENNADVSVVKGKIEKSSEKSDGKNKALAYTPDFNFDLLYGDYDPGKSVQEDFGNESDGKAVVSESVVPGVRKLSEYITKYATARLSLSDMNSGKKEKTDESKTQASVSSKKSKKDKNASSNTFYIEEWGPQGEIVAESQNPSFYVIFSKPVKPLKALEEPTSTSEFLSIEPKLPGVFRWYGNQHLSFEASQAADPSKTYVLTVPETVKSLDGDALTGDRVFKTVAKPIKILQLYAGYIGDSEFVYSKDSGAIPPYDKTFLLRLNYAIPSEAFDEVVNVRIEETRQRLSVSAEPVYSDKYLFSWGTRKTIYNEEEKTTNTFIVTIKDELPKNQTVVVIASTGNTSAQETFLTVRPFSVKKVNHSADYSGKHNFPLSITFNQVPDIKSCPESFSFDFEYQLTEANFEVNGNTLKIFDLPINYDENHTITIKDSLKDIYGQQLSAGAKTYNFVTLSPKSYLKFTDTGFNILEAQFPPRYLFEYQNVEPGSFYKIYSTKMPQNTDSLWTDNKTPLYSLDKQVKNTRMFEDIDLTPYLNNGYGAVRFDSRIFYKEYNKWREEFELRNDKTTTTIQVTDLGVTARLGINKAAVLVSSMKTGKPIENATVYICGFNEYQTVDELKTKGIISKGITDQNGFVVIDFEEYQRREIERLYSKNYYSQAILIYVENGDDSVLFSPYTNQMRGEGSWRYPSFARRPNEITYMFVDRGLYRPGEIVSFRGIDRDLCEGVLSVPSSSYDIEVKENRWDSNRVIARLSGRVSESGGFYGSFKIPEDSPTGQYRLTFKRRGDSYGESIYFTVAEFERLKYQASVKVPEVTYFGGDSLSAELGASYLAGGPLGGASYEVQWFRQPTRFNPTTAETKNFIFGGTNSSYSRDLVSEEKGVLNAEGKAMVSCKTEKVVDGRPYEYRVSASFTDLSNQRISSSNAVIVHPASFYVGISRPSNVSGFAKKGQKLDISYILVNSKGEKLSNAAMNQVKQLKYSLTREEWVMAHEQSVYNSIYTRYTRKEVLEQEGEIALQSKSDFSITPKATGWYTLEVRGTDKEGNPTISAYGFYVTGGNSYWYNDNDGQHITLTPNQTLYNPGETAQILMESALPAGDYLITVEREGIFSEEVRHFDSPANVIEVPIAENYVPIVYVAVSSYSVRTQPPSNEYGEVDMNKPKSYFGVTPLYVNPDVRSFKIDVKCDKPSYRPGDDCTVTLTATRGGKPLSNAELTLMAVDRGVIDLINYHVPNPIECFYAEYNYPNCVVGGDSRAFLMDPITYSIKDLAGGDADEEKENERKDFRPTAVFEPVLITGEDGTVQCTFKMPDSLTTYRITAFGVQKDLFALQEDEVKVQNPVNVMQVQPRKLRVRDTAECGVLITNLSEKMQEVTVSIEVRSPEGNTVQDEQEGRITIPGAAFVDGPSMHTVKVESNSSSVVYFDVGASAAGTVEIVYTVNSEILNEKLISPVNIEETYVYETVTMTSSTSDSQNEQIILPGFAKQGANSLKFTLDATQLGPLSSAVTYLFDYPYGCLEQQSAQVLPLVIFEDYIDVFDLDKRVGNIHKLVKNYAKQWAKCQLPNGGFPYWPDRKESSVYVSVRMAHIYALAKERGYSDKDLQYNIDALCNFLKGKPYNDSITPQKAYIAYVLAMNKDPAAEKLLDSLASDVKNANNVTLAYVGLGYAKLGKMNKAGEMAQELRKYIQSAERSVTILQKEGDAFDLWYSSDVSVLSLALQLYVTINPEDPLVNRLIFTTLKQKSAKGYWNNTSDTAKVLEAVYTYIKKLNLDNLNFTADAKIAGTQVIDGKFKGVAAKPISKTISFTDSTLAEQGYDKEIPVTFEKEGEGELYYTVEMRYALPDEILTGRDEGIEIAYTIVDSETGEKINLSKPIVELQSGKTYKATITVSSPRNRTYLAMRAPIPSGAEIMDSTFVTTGEIDGPTQEYKYGMWRQWLTRKSIRDNEIQFFWDSFGSGSTTINFTFRTARRGIYPTPPVQAECMYEPEIFGRTDGNLYIIK